MHKDIVSVEPTVETLTYGNCENPIFGYTTYGLFTVPLNGSFQFKIGLGNWLSQGLDSAASTYNIMPEDLDSIRFLWNTLSLTFAGFGRPKTGKEERGSGDNLLIGWAFDKNLINVDLIILVLDSLSNNGDDSLTSRVIATWFQEIYPDIFINNNIQQAYEEYLRTNGSIYSGYQAAENITRNFRRNPTKGESGMGKAIYGLAGMHMSYTSRTNDYCLLAGSADLGVFGNDIPIKGKRERVNFLSQGSLQTAKLDRTNLTAEQKYDIKTTEKRVGAVYDYVGVEDPTDKLVCVEYSGPNFTCLPFLLQGAQFALMSDGVYRDSPFTSNFINGQLDIQEWYEMEYNQFIKNLEEGSPNKDDQIALYCY